MIVHQRWAIAILRVKSIDVKGGQSVVRFHDPKVIWNLPTPGRNP